MESKVKATLPPFIKSFLVACIVFLIGAAQCSNPTTGLGAGSTAVADTTDLLFRKTIPTEVEKAAGEALSHYPELRGVRIVFSYDEEFHNSFMQAQPKVSSMFKDKEERVYKIIMTREMEVQDTLIPVEKLPHDVLVGWIGHELGHIMDYLNRSSVNMAWFGLKYYFSDKYKTKAEREADLYAIRHGLADNIIATKNFILSNTSLPPYYIQKIERLYLSPENVLEIVEELEEEAEEDEASNNREDSPDFSMSRGS